MKKEVILCDENSFKIKQIEIGEIKNNFYLKFYFSEQLDIRNFSSYLRTRLAIWTSDADEPIQFRELSYTAANSLNIVVVGNIKQAIDFFRIDGLFPPNVNKILDDVDEDEIQQILTKSEKGNTFLSTVPVSKYINHDFFPTEESKSKENTHTSTLDSIRNFLCLKC